MDMTERAASAPDPAGGPDPADGPDPAGGPERTGASGLAGAPGRAGPERGYSASKDQLLARLRRIEGQIRGIEGMVLEDRYCIDVLTQIGAAQAALDKVALGLLDDHAHHCVLGAAEPADRDAKTEELMAAVGRLVRRR
jgi:DNA-binding FrmR family transcriptional regulator